MAGGILLREEKLDLTECCSVSLQFERGRIVLASWICHGKDERRPGARGDVGKRGNLLIKPLEGTAPYIAGGARRSAEYYGRLLMIDSIEASIRLISSREKRLKDVLSIKLNLLPSSRRLAFSL